MSDLIDRQAAISAICSACGKIDCDKMDKCEKLQLPPANCSEFPNSSDTISRAKAIDALTEYGNGRAVFISVGEAVIRIEQLPSAEPEIIRCKDCMYTDGDKPIADGRYWCMLHGTFMYYCSDAERGSDETNRRRQATGR